ncbi:HlyD family type I secretion periplasmic adaptor subunit [Neopusillimonas aromaticivorans]|uniref:HlyD family type I secretion periplasmic adaptor subunit n=1 Tax=Neopusillimonas aromaticivorans TaxID=2979868 RepID=UPI002591AA69|nr:HlyD family type I secretion periplasmic adaptor subunit [Neopusillimonas aromaticivorans]WJJ94692.1 HlyD family type I secretion periplasmic adaptor subunit [Neopusillimonas aromaticivorans]
MNWLKKKINAEPIEVSDHIDTNSRAPVRWGLAVLLIGFGGFALWAGFAPLGAGIPAEGVVVVSGNRKIVQHLQGGIIDEILVKEGDRVKAEEVLLRLNPTQPQAEQGIVSTQYITAKATEARLLAERDGLSEIVYDPDFLARFKDDERFKNTAVAQERLFQTRRDALQGEIAILRENQRGAEAQLKGLTQVQSSRKTQIDFINRELKGVRELAKDGYLPRNRLFELERDAAQLEAALSNDMVEAGRVRNQIAELKLRILQRSQDYQKEVQSMLSDVQKEAAALHDRLASLDFTLANTQIRSPIDGIVQNVQTHTVGGVIGPGATLMEVVPEGDAYLIQAQVPVQAVDQLHVGLPVDITFPAFNHASTPNIPGTVITVSADRLIDENTRMPYYRAQIEVTPEGMDMLKDNLIRAGMPTSVMIRTGERTMLSYLLKPLLDRMLKSFKEQ